MPAAAGMGTHVSAQFEDNGEQHHTNAVDFFHPAKGYNYSILPGDVILTTGGPQRWRWNKPSLTHAKFLAGNKTGQQDTVPSSPRNINCSQVVNPRHFLQISPHGLAESIQPMQGQSTTLMHNTEDKIRRNIRDVALPR